MRTSRNIALRTAILFSVVGFAWIFLSDRVVNWVAERQNFSMRVVTNIQDTKGIFFVAVCGALLYLSIYRSTRKLHRSRQEYRNLFRNNPAPMYIYKPESGHFLAMNDSCCEQYGYSEPELKSITIRDIRVSHINEHTQFMNTDFPLGMKDVGLYRHRRKNGTEFWVHKYARKIEFGNDTAQLVLAFDVTDQILAEERLVKQNRRLADLAWFESHKLRAPIARLLGLLNVIRINDKVDTASPDVLKHVYDTGVELDALVRQLSLKTTALPEEQS